MVVVVPVAVVATLGAAAFAALPAAATVSMHEQIELAAAPSSAVSPLGEIGGRLTEPGRTVFTVRTDAAVDRWPTAVLDGFDGADWTSSAHYRPLGRELVADPAVTVPTRTAAADVELDPSMTSPWLPTRFRVRSVEGVAPAVDPRTGVLLLPRPQPGVGYRFTWQEPVPEPGRLAGAVVDLTAPGAVAPGAALDGLDDLVTAATGGVSAAAPTFDTALHIERWFRENYRRSPEGSPATGNSTRQLRRFLEDTRTGTSEQFAAAFVLVAADAGLPARLVVGFRNPGLADADGRVAVHNSDVLAWPEVAVAGVGWVALDPTGDAASNPTGGNGLAEAVDAARDDLPAQARAPEPQPVPRSPSVAPVSPVFGGSAAGWWIAAAVAGSLVLAVLAVPVLKRVRRFRRRRAPGVGAVHGAWLDTRDALGDHGVPVSPGHTARDLTELAAPVLGDGVGPLHRLARSVDAACWASPGASDPRLVTDAWAAATEVRRALARRPVPDRLRAAVRMQPHGQPMKNSPWPRTAVRRTLRAVGGICSDHCYVGRSPDDRGIKRTGRGASGSR
ncbi:transglutaminase domain-containing protein [Pseudonocardia broussonetiae]|uniref:Transglutaminase domain-containing protein n=1 Tax=Pseudonocardia broussonetiae TaxID=2736640 RepID=A0A6M6JNP4_9PSEU|nr:transglutaminase domain-containing protein [Pseudonocardia broussonetiae]QJY47931.1 transglutaminase domain-containing protein [Pseudonocardia broussonetiae]